MQVLPEGFHDKANKALELMRDGLSVKEACEEVGIQRTTFRNNVEKDTYTRAREEGYIAQAEEIGEWERRLETGELDPNAARVMLEMRKWRLAKLSQFLADKPQTQVNVQTNVQLVNPTEALAQIMAQED